MKSQILCLICLSFFFTADLSGQKIFCPDLDDLAYYDGETEFFCYQSLDGTTIEIPLHIYVPTDVHQEYHIYYSIGGGPTLQNPSIIFSNPRDTEEIDPVYWASVGCMDPKVSTSVIHTSITLDYDEICTAGVDVADITLHLHLVPQFAMPTCLPNPYHETWDINICCNPNKGKGDPDTFNYSTEQNSQINLYPNPSSSVVNMDDLEVGSEIQVVSIENKAAILESNSQTSHQIDVSSLENGMYYIFVTKPNGERAAGKFLKY